MTRMTGPYCAVMCNLINTHTHTNTHLQTTITYKHRLQYEIFQLSFFVKGIYIPTYIYIHTYIHTYTLMEVKEVTDVTSVGRRGAVAAESSQHFFLRSEPPCMPTEYGRNPVSKHQIQPEYGDEQADAGRTAEPVSRDQILRRERGQGNIHFPCSADHEQD